jgi:hypothetical protein
MTSIIRAQRRHRYDPHKSKELLKNYTAPSACRSIFNNHQKLYVGPLLQILLDRLVQQIALLRASRRRTVFAGPPLGTRRHSCCGFSRFAAILAARSQKSGSGPQAMVNT